MSRKDTTLQPLSSNAVSAKELARSLGLVKKRTSCSTSRSKDQEKEIKPSQYFAYLIVLDFESTCWKDKKMNYGPEIKQQRKKPTTHKIFPAVEFPAVLLNTFTGELESEFHMFVQPSEHRRLSEFCTELTGITQTQVDEGIPVGTCLMLFGRWLQEMREKKGFKFPCEQVLNKDGNESTENLTKWCTFVSWSDWDLGTCLKNECYRKQIRVPHPLRSWIDLQATYKNFYSCKPQGLAGALQDLGIQFTGREHSGLADARNTARLAWRMVSDGCIMQITKNTDGVVEKLCNIVMKRPGHLQNSLRANSTGESHTSTHNKNVLACEDTHALHNKNHVKPFKICTGETSVNDSLNFGNAQAENHGRYGTRHNVTVKKELTGPRADQIPGNRMTKVREKSLVWGALVSRDISKENGQVKRRTSDSSVSEGIAIVNCDGACSTPDNNTKSLITPTTSLASLNKRARGCCNGLFKSEMHSCLTQGILVKRGLAKQTLSYHQQTPLASRNQRVSLGAGRKDNTASKRPCKASNIESQGVTTPLFRLPTNQSLTAERHPVEGLKNDRFITVASNNAGTTANKPLAKAMTVTTTPSSIHSNKPCTTPIRKFVAFNSPPHGNIKTKSPITSPVACFNGGGITPPLCHCGRRTRRRSVINPGPNQGRAFFTCSLSHGRSRFCANADKKKSKSGCKYFRWEVR